ncbi:uncharacterized protein EI97DRAFT_378179 [Westerdykella ornata]|uniref:FHA domain-containing protein n=1 Tax=Westerdykella ornata TaxID=318751 RepID=A0A6A6JI87_WESOR|nr:uncharacterized protein EI97DRAFT_378179 [Westerdykella ornata]KAF2275945.1 hypothetical protein EI97DRAFT_378179 [Westerdykella ornata]
MPRKSVQRSNSSSSLNSNASTGTVIASTSAQTNGVGPAPAGDASTWAARKKASRGLWPTSKTEPVSGISTARPQSIASASSGPSAASAMTALHTPAPMVPSHQNGAVQSAQNGPGRAQPQENSAILHLTPMNGTFDRKTITVPFFPDVLRIGRQTNNKTVPTPINGFFDSKVLSRQHAEIWADRTGKIWIRDVKSSNGTFVNGQRLSPENRDSDPHELKKGDMLELGIDIVSEDQKTIVHHKVAAHVEHAGIYPTAGGNLMDINFGDMDSVQALQNIVGGGGQQQLPSMRGRNLSQGSINAARMQAGAGQLVGGAGSMQPPRHWLQPITIEQVVKKLNAEIKAARQQSQDLQQTQHYITAMLTAEPKKESSKHSVKFSPVKDIKNRFSEPPAPPPQQPLPEKPDGPSLRRSDTERPVGSSSPSRTNSRIASLAEELSSARKEIEAQSLRVRDLEALLSEERRAREDAEERANRLERESFKDRQQPADDKNDEELNASTSTSRPDEVDQTKDGTSSPNIVDVATSRLQLRLETMMAEMNEMKQQMEIYRKRAEEAEADSAVHRRSLAEMIEKIRQEDAKKAARIAQRKARSAEDRDSASPTLEDEGEEWEDPEEGEIPIMNGKDLDIESPGGLLYRVGLQPGRHDKQDASETLTRAANSLATRQPSHNDLVLTHGAPAISILTVVALGVAVMAWLNSYPKVER